MNQPLRDAETIEAQARDLVLRLAESPDVEAECDAWRAADPRHDEAFRAAQLTWSALGRTAYTRTADWREAARPRRRWIPAAAIAAGLALAAVVAPQALSQPDQQLRTGVAQTGALGLDGGGEVLVGARSAVEVRRGDEGQRTRLKSGEAFFVAPAGRTLVVTTDDAVIRAAGARFNVRCTPGGVKVEVQDGVVRVVPRRLPIVFWTPPAKPRAVAGGQQVRVEDGGPVQVASLNGEAGAWRGGRLQYADAPLEEVVADANRYSAQPIRLASRDLRDLRVTVSFRTGAVDELIASLDAGLPLSAERQDDGAVVLRAAP